MTRWTAEGLRHAALAALGPYSDERARDALARAALVVEPDVAHWESSRGRMRAHRVHLLLDARRLGLLRANPAVLDALRASMAAAIAGDPHETLHELMLAWAPEVPEAPYRDAPRGRRGEATDLRLALMAYLQASDQPELAAVAGRAEIRVSRVRSRLPGVRVDLPEVDRDSVQADLRASAAMIQALRDLVGDPQARVTLHAI